MRDAKARCTLDYINEYASQNQLQCCLCLFALKRVELLAERSQVYWKWLSIHIVSSYWHTFDLIPKACIQLDSTIFSWSCLDVSQFAVQISMQQTCLLSFCLVWPKEIDSSQRENRFPLLIANLMCSGHLGKLWFYGNGNSCFGNSVLQR